MDGIMDALEALGELGSNIPGLEYVAKAVYEAITAYRGARRNKQHLKRLMELVVFITHGLCTQDVGVLKRHEKAIDGLVKLMYEVRDFSVVCGSTRNFKLLLKHGDHSESIRELHDALIRHMAGFQFLATMENHAAMTQRPPAYAWASEEPMKALLDHALQPWIDEIRVHSRGVSMLTRMIEESGKDNKVAESKAEDLRRKIDVTVELAHEQKRTIEALVEQQKFEKTAEREAEIAHQRVLLIEQEKEIERLKAKLKNQRAKAVKKLNNEIAWWQAKLDAEANREASRVGDLRVHLEAANEESNRRQQAVEQLRKESLSTESENKRLVEKLKSADRELRMAKAAVQDLSQRLVEAENAEREREMANAAVQELSQQLAEAKTRLRQALEANNVDVKAGSTSQGTEKNNRPGVNATRSVPKPTKLEATRRVGRASKSEARVAALMKQADSIDSSMKNFQAVLEASVQQTVELKAGLEALRAQLAKQEAGLEASNGIAKLNSETYSLREEVTTSGSVGYTAAKPPDVASGEWPEATAVLSQTDRAEDVDPSRQRKQDASSTLSMNLLASSASFNPAGGDGDGEGDDDVSVPRVPGGYVGDSANSLDSSLKGSEASWDPRLLGSVAAALGDECSHDHEGAVPERRFGGGSAFEGAQSEPSYRTEDESVGGLSTSTFAALEGLAELEAYEAELAAPVALAAVPEVGTRRIDGPAATGPITAAATAAGLPPSGRWSYDRSRIQSSNPAMATATATTGPRSSATFRARSRAGSNSSLAEELNKDLPDVEHQMRARQQDAARAASPFRGMSFKPADPPTVTAAAAAPAAEKQGEASPSRAATQLMGKVVAGMGMVSFFGLHSPTNAASAPAAIASDTRTLERLPMDDGGASMPMSELLQRAELEASAEHTAQIPTVPPLPAAAVPPKGASSAVALSATPAAAPSTTTRATKNAQLQQSVVGSQSPSLYLARLLHNAEGPGMTLEEVEACLASPVVASPPALLRPGVGATARRVWPGPPRGRGLLRRNSASGSYTSYSNNTSITEDMMSGNNLIEDEMPSDGQPTDESRTSSFAATGSSFEENLLQSQAARSRFEAGAGAGAGRGGDSATGSVGAAATRAVAGSNPAPGGGSLGSLAERLARTEEIVGREHEKGLVYRQGPEGVAAAVAGDELPLPRPGWGSGGSPAVSGGGSSIEEEKVGSLDDILARADGGVGNLKETFRLLDDMEARRLEELNAAAMAVDADDDTKARWRGSLAELMLKVERSGNLRDILDMGSETSESASTSNGNKGSPPGGNRGGGLSLEIDSTSGSVAQREQPAFPKARSE